MIRTSYDAPDTLTRPNAWRSEAACLREDANLFFPDGTTGPWLVIIEQAKAVCRSCPVIESCLKFAMESRATDGIFGGLTTDERHGYRRSSAYRRAQPPNRSTPQAAPKTLTEAFARHTKRAEDGHLLWYGGEKLKFQGAIYTALQAAFIVAHGREPDGPVRRTCGIDCYRGDHLTDSVIRERHAAAQKAAKPAREPAKCGTRSGYQKHVREKTVICGPCRQANTDADRRLRRTGTTKVAV
ncbi:Transcriptional regulator WhiB OS=Streptomyces aurantiogriseus OX=66870 GN=whiB PE=3 SV=1 [Streptomyces aurantiogriseus]|uniref:Transcriptional regulator WhiB n=1 Tax=Streptomyces aurantiogriseus TaxID=66870 RepID=A0A918FNN8_9ACTN|nr:hypothetical protein GCM10010251_92270 [Streptomyces aurantiogriseus]